MKSLSVITVTYNAAPTLVRTLQSVREQTYPHIEHLIVDGASKDNTVALIKQYAHEKMVWVSEPDKGLYDAMNKGIARAAGEFIVILNAGDIVPGDCLIQESKDLFIDEATQKKEYSQCVDISARITVTNVPMKNNFGVESGVDYWQDFEIPVCHTNSDES